MNIFSLKVKQAKFAGKQAPSHPFYSDVLVCSVPYCTLKFNYFFYIANANPKYKTRKKKYIHFPTRKTIEDFHSGSDKNTSLKERTEGNLRIAFDSFLFKSAELMNPT